MKTRVRSARKKKRPSPANRVTELVSLFRKFLDARRLALDPSDVLGGFDAVIAFQSAVLVGGKSSVEKSDLLLFQFASTGAAKWRRTSISAVRQLYGGPGKTHRLIVEWVFDVAQLDLGTRTARLWSNEFKSIPNFATQAKAELATLGSLPPAHDVVVRLERV